MLHSELSRQRERLGRHIDRILRGLETTLNLSADQGLVRLDPLGSFRGRLERLEQRLDLVAPFRRLEAHGLRLATLGQRLRLAAHNAVFVGIPNKTGAYPQRLDSAISKILGQRVQRLGLSSVRLGGLDPESPLDRGFVLALDEKSQPIKSSLGMSPNARLRLRWKDGERRARVE
jgi:exodeoxyribonuclease VII large subunit